jgi:very-short-patch-repair endonuclease
MTRNSPHPPRPTLPLAGRVAKLEAKPRSAAREGGGKPQSLAKKLRATPTVSELRMWQLLHSFRVTGFHFRKQMKLGSYVVDFVCVHAGLVIEVDGITHHSERAQSNDETRDDYLKGRGFTVLRFASEDVMRNEEGVCAMITAALDGKPRNHRGSSPPSLAALGPVSPSSATLPARGRVGDGSHDDNEDNV